MDQFGEIKFNVANELGASGTYDGKRFIIIDEVEDEDGNSTYGIVEGYFTDEERLFIFTQWTQLESDTEMKIGDVVDEETVENYINVLPPATMNGSLIQMGEPYSHIGDRATYPTLAKVDGQWTYAGHCYRGESKDVIRVRFVGADGWERGIYRKLNSDMLYAFSSDGEWYELTEDGEPLCLVSETVVIEL